MKMRLYTPISVLLIAGLGAAGCAESFDDAPETHQSSSQELVLLSLKANTPGARAMNLVHSEERGWHLSFTANLQETNLPGAQNFTVLPQSLEGEDDFGDFGDFGDFENEDAGQDFSSGSSVQPSRFNASLAGSSRYSASVPGAYGFSTSLAGSSSFSASTPASYSFSTGLSTGGQCSLNSVCDFVATVCRFAPQYEGCDGSAIAECRAGVRELEASVPAEAAPFMCILGNFFSCATAAISSGGNPEAAMNVCGANLFGELLAEAF